MNAPNDEAPSGRGKGLQDTEKNGHADSIKSARFVGTDGPRQLRAINILLRHPLPRESLDGAVGCSNGPDLIAGLRRQGLEIPCERINFVDRDGKSCHPGVYHLTTTDRRRIYAWLARGRRG